VQRLQPLPPHEASLAARPLGKSGISVSSFCFGTWELGGLAWGPITAEDGVALLRRAREQGVTTYDCSDIYGNGRSEVLLGLAFQGQRDRVVYVTKAGYLVGTDGTQSLRSRPAIASRDQDYTPPYLRWACEQSLRRLATDYIDVYLLHDPPDAVLADPVPFAALRELQREGKIRTYGVSSGAVGAERAIRRHGAQVVMVPFNLLDQTAAPILLPLARERGVGVLARSPFASGLLHDAVVAAARWGRQPPFSPHDLRRHVRRWRLMEVAWCVHRLGFLTERAGGSVSRAALRFALSYPGIAAVATGVIRLAELEAALAACREAPFDAVLLNRAAAAARLPAAYIALRQTATWARRVWRSSRGQSQGRDWVQPPL
jgi:aryl-alcohol dehydrogenase-like predicted oxidoreductase